MSTKKKYLLLLTFCILPFTLCLSQDFNPPAPKKENEKKPFWSWDKVYGGGGVGLWFGSSGAFVNLSPQVGYKITEKFSAGLGITYMYISDKRYVPPIKINIYGGNIFSRYLFTEFLFAYAEYEPLNGNWNTPLSNERFFIQNVWLGGGFRQRAGNSSLNIMGLWNLNDEGYVQNPQIRIGINIGL